MDRTFLGDLFSAFGAIDVRRMFGGHGIYRDGTMFALEAGGTLYLKADAAFGGELEGRGSEPFSYVASNGRRTVMSYWRVPEAAMDDPEDLAALSRRAFEIARRAPAKPRRAKAAR
ncbi:TfoX/Sxy family protein [Xanthobacter tagetidis]|nr:TfoX/Sxy family protein [Xanthobacter tagetidis]MBB6309629.1 DNA transformation protein [Xanthobacter tagetidis]